MNRTALFLLVVALLLVSGNSYAAVPCVKIYFDETLEDTHPVCPGPKVDKFYVVAHNFDVYMSAVQYRIDYGNLWAFLGDDVDEGTLVIGQSPDGISLAFPAPLDACGPVVVQRVDVFWMCNDCAGWREYSIRVLPYPSTGKIEAVRWPDMARVTAYGLESIICPYMSTKQTTWGNVKSLYK